MTRDLSFNKGRYHICVCQMQIQYLTKTVFVDLLVRFVNLACLSVYVFLCQYGYILQNIFFTNTLLKAVF